MTADQSRPTAASAPVTDMAARRSTGAVDRRAFGLTAATALVLGSIVGTGIFALPSSLAVYGPVSIVSFALVTVGSVALALVFGWLARRVPGSGGPYVYARDAFGDFAGFLTAWSYWITAWAGNAAIVVAWVGYVEVYINKGHSTGWAIVIALVGLWVPAAVNLTGLRSIGATQVITAVLKFVPLLFVGVAGLVYFKSARLGPFNASHLSATEAISAAAAIALFSYLGLETASVAAGTVRNPGRNVMRATVLGTLLAAVVYIAGTVAVFGTVAHQALVKSVAPFADSATNMFGSWAGDLVAVTAIISGLGALNGWTMITAEMPYAAALDGLFPKPFTRTSRGVPAFGIIAGATFASLITVFSYTRFKNVFTVIVLLSVMTSVVPYLFSAAAQVYWLIIRGRPAHWAHLVRDVSISALALVFSFWALAGSGYQTVYYGTFCLFLGIPVYVWLKYGRREYGETAVTPVAYKAAQPQAKTFGVGGGS